MNEELLTLNNELQVKMDDLSRLNNDMKNLLDNAEIAILFMDNAMRVRLFTTGTNRIFKLIPGDVGRPITDIASDLLYPELAEHAREVLRALVFHEQQAATSDGRWFTVRIMPYRTLENMIDGVVIAFTDITISKTLEATLREALLVLQSRFTEQTEALDIAQTAESVLKKAQAVLEKQYSDQKVELGHARADLKTEKEKKT